jgi:hypothetical protein
MQPISFKAVRPRTGFTWIYKGSGGKWELREPPEDWPEEDYQAPSLLDYTSAKELLAHKLVLSERFHVAALKSDFEDDSGGADRATIVTEPDLYLSGY